MLPVFDHVGDDSVTWTTNTIFVIYLPRARIEVASSVGGAVEATKLMSNKGER